MLASVPKLAVSSAPEDMAEFFDRDYGYRFKYPSGWKIQKLPEGQANKDFRVMLYGPAGSSFMVIVEPLGEKTTKEDFHTSEERTIKVKQLISRTIEHIYQTVSRNVKATKMTVGEQRDLSTDEALQFYISTLHTRAGASPVIFAGIHTFPFSKDYSVNFVMTALLDESKATDNTLLLAVFNSFRLTRSADSVPVPSAPQSGEERTPAR